MRELELLKQYGAEDLVSELQTWEALRARMTLPRYAPPARPTRTLFLLDGIPGAGKSTALAWLRPALDAEWMSMARFAQAADVSRDERMHHELSTGTPHRVDGQFLEAIDAQRSRWIALEKFPRSVVEARAMLEACAARGWRFEVLHLFLPDDCVKTSVERQLARGPRHGLMPTTASATHRALAHLARAFSCRESLRTAGVPIHSIDTSQPREVVERLARRALGLDFASLDWHRAPLERLERVSAQLRVEAWVAGGHVYRAFWNGVFGPSQLPHDVDVAVNAQRDVAPLLEALQREAPQFEWSVLAPSQRLRDEFGLETADAREAKAHATWVHRCGLVRWQHGAPVLALPDGTEAALRNGVIKLNARLLERLTPQQREAHLARQAHRAPSVLRDYPGLRLSEAAPGAATPEAKLHPVIHGEWRELKRAVLQDASRARRPSLSRRALNRSEEVIAQEILALHRASSHAAQPPPLPPRGDAPEGDFATLSLEADDASFARWLIAQRRRFHEVRLDPWLRAVLDGSLFGGELEHGHRAQSAMHQGWQLEQHLVESVVQLDTSVAGDDAQLRRAMRVAMLFHDTGKLAGQRPQRHATISAALFAKHRPAWFPDELVALTQWMISTHDLFGVFGRGLTEKRDHAVADYALDLATPSSYPFALDAQAVRRALRDSRLPLEDAAAVHEAIWRADVGSIAALRWLLPTAALVKRLVLVSPSR